jgi:hypothetical protein
MRNVAAMNLSAHIVHVIDREADSVRHYREWDAEGFQVLVRADVASLKMGYYYGNSESNGKVSFYREHYWAVKDAMIEGIRMDTGTIDCVFKTSNDYDFSEAFPKLKKTTIETWDAEGKKLFDSEISTITSIDFTMPDVTVFDPKQYIK